MSPFISILESPMSPFTGEADFFSSASSTTSSSSSPSQYFSNADFGGGLSLSMKPYNDLPDHRTQGFSPISSVSSASLGRSTSFSRSSKAPSRSPPVRQRTPIRHSRLSTSRPTGTARPEALLAYATQEAQVSSLQNMNGASGGFPPASFTVPSSTSSYPAQSGIYAPAVSRQSSSYPFTAQHRTVEPSPASYTGAGRGYPFESQTGNNSDETYLPPPFGSNVPDNMWQPPPRSQIPPYLPPIYNQPSVAQPGPDVIRVINSRPKPQCWAHGCNGRQFSTFSNLLRHQREKSGNASKHLCPHCGTEFTRTTARKGHMEGGKCKGSQDRQDEPSTEA